MTFSRTFNWHSRHLQAILVAIAHTYRPLLIAIAHTYSPLLIAMANTYRPLLIAIADTYRPLLIAMGRHLSASFGHWPPPVALLIGSLLSKAATCCHGNHPSLDVCWSPTPPIFRGH